MLDPGFGVFSTREGFEVETILLDGLGIGSGRGLGALPGKLWAVKTLEMKF